jgi:hypothetical protein
MTYILTNNDGTIKEYEFFIDTGIMKCPNCCMNIIPKGPFEIDKYEPIGNYWRVGKCPICECEAVIP